MEEQRHEFAGHVVCAGGAVLMMLSHHTRNREREEGKRDRETESEGEKRERPRTHTHAIFNHCKAPSRQRVARSITLIARGGKKRKQHRQRVARSIIARGKKKRR